MPEDFRDLGYSLSNVKDSGRFLGRNFYWKFYALENLVRILIYTVLTEQLGRKWWTKVTNPDIEGKLKSVLRGRIKRPFHSAAGSHRLYNIFLPDLIHIVRTTADQFRPLYNDVDAWVIRLEAIHQPRNLASHMNWLNTKDRRLVDLAYKKTLEAVAVIGNSGIQIKLPRK